MKCEIRILDREMPETKIVAMMAEAEVPTEEIQKEGNCHLVVRFLANSPVYRIVDMRLGFVARIKEGHH